MTHLHSKRKLTFQGSIQFIAFTVFATCANTEIRLPRLIGSHMVLQRNSEAKIWGWAEPGEKVELHGSWLDTPAQTVARSDGFWKVAVQTTADAGPHTIELRGTNTIGLEDILFGEVWIAPGQSNMEMPLIKTSNGYTGIKDAGKEVAAAHHPQIRLFQAGNFSSIEPQEDVSSGISMYGVPLAKCDWQLCSPETIPTFSSTAYFFARELHETLNVPIGIIDASWGGTSAESWTPKSGLEFLGYESDLEQAATKPQKPDDKVPTRLYNGMIHPLRHLKIKGTIWYQGESNTTRAEKYEQLFSTMITEWRRAFNDDFSFYFTQISPFNYENRNNRNAAFLREAQLKTLSVPQTGMAVTMDIGNLTDIHPKNKQEVGRRLALWALANDYGQDVAYSGPQFNELMIENAEATLSFDFANGGLTTIDGQAPSHFEIAGEDRNFQPAEARIKGNKIIVSSDKVSHPVAVRYAFSSDATPNLVNVAGLPASSFRTDNY